ncbi:MAG: prolyl-tRNA synthetase associated domain-containing protein [Candidatus Peribacteraceae bacterium]|nr:prolyl-tRNA synthetase associated domain-containing protein [Candidatus Peribacteraceae bacterium]
MPSIEEFLENHSVSYERFDHPAVFTCEQSVALNLKLPGADTKNLFIHAKKKKEPILVVVGHEKRAHMRELGRLLNEKDLCFGSPEMLKEYLGVEPGSVTALALINDPSHKVRLIIDTSVWEAESIQWHPLINTATLVIAHAEAEKFFKATGHEVEVMEVPEK